MSCHHFDNFVKVLFQMANQIQQFWEKKEEE